MMDFYVILDVFLSRFYFWSRFFVGIVNIGLAIALILSIISAVIHGSWQAMRSIPSFLILLSLGWLVQMWLYGAYEIIYAMFGGILWIFLNFP
ncbi:MAG: hypothetical protein ACXQS8_03700 [Candidatus Helarchaeales archaeon]